MSEKSRAKQASEELDKLEAQVKSGAISLGFALTKAFVQGAAFQEESSKGSDEVLFRAAWNEGAAERDQQIRAESELADRIAERNETRAWTAEWALSLANRLLARAYGEPIGGKLMVEIDEHLKNYPAPRGEATRRVFAALRRIPEQDLEAWLAEPPATNPEAYEDLARAELYRREKEGQ